MKDEDSKEGTNRNHLNAREQACIHLRIADSGTPWLDNLIRQSIHAKTEIVGDSRAQLPLFGSSGS